MSYTWNCKAKLQSQLLSQLFDASLQETKIILSQIDACDDKTWCLNKATCPDWKILLGCFSEERRVDGRTGDIDGFVHQGNSVLFLEKKSIGVGLSGPLVRAFNTLAAQGNSAIAVWYDEPDGSDICRMMVWGIDGYKNEFASATITDFRTAVRAWWTKNYRGTVDPTNPLNCVQNARVETRP
jgi:hypothetical protein